MSIDIESGQGISLADVGINMAADGSYLYRQHSITSLRKKQIEELNEVSGFLREQWGTTHPEVSGSELVTILDVGGLVLTIHDNEGHLVGASQVLSGASDRENQRCLITDQTAILEEHRDFGLGRALKQVTFAKALERDITRVYVTFDPSRANLWGLNIARLGGQIVDFVENKYGAELAGKQNSSDLPSDRVVGIWDLGNPSIIRRIMGEKTPIYKSDVACLNFNNDLAGVAERAKVLSRCHEDSFIVGYQDGVVTFGPRLQNFGLRDDD